MSETHDHIDLKIFLRLLACSTQVEDTVRGLMRRQFGTTLARFDYLAQLDRHPEGLRLCDLSRHLMVTRGNVTSVTQHLVADGWVAKTPDPEDGRSSFVRLTSEGARVFDTMARQHESWLKALFQELGMPVKEVLYEHLGQLRLHLAGLGHVFPAATAAHDRTY